MRAVVVLLVTGASLVAYLRAAGRARPTPPSWRQGAFAVGTLAVAAGLTMPDDSFSRHVGAHLLVAVLGPVLIALGAPLAVASSASVRVRRGTARLRHRPAARAATHPLTVWLLFNGSLAALYLTPLYRWSLRNTVVHEAVHAHMLLAGLLFAELAVGSVPLPSRPAFPARAAAVGFSLPVHALLGLAVLSLPTPSLQPAGAAGGLADQQAGGWLLWVAGDLVVSNVLVGLVLAWAADEERRERVTRLVPAAMGIASGMSDTPPLRDSDITRDEPTENGPTEGDENLDTGGDGPRDTGDEQTEGLPGHDAPTEDDENLDTGGDGPRDTGDERSEGAMTGGRTGAAQPASGGDDYRLAEDGPGPVGGDRPSRGAEPGDVVTDDAYLDDLHGSGGDPDLVNPVDPTRPRSR